MNGEDNISRLPFKGARAASLAVLAFLFGAFLSLYAGFSKSDKIDSSSLGKTLADNTVYVVSENTTIERPSYSPNSALYVENGGTTVIYIPKNVTLTVKGGNAQGKEGAGAGIRLNSGSTLVVTGDGTLDVTGGNAASGASGGNAGSTYQSDDDFYAGGGGAGGDGGGGAAAAIGGVGGNGGAGGSGGASGGWIDADDIDDDGPDGNSGKGGTGGESGTAGGDLWVLGSVTVKATGGSKGNGGSSGSYGNSKWDYWSYEYHCGAGGGGGGGAGGAAAPYGVGGGGAGGGGGGGGGSGGYFYTTRGGNPGSPDAGDGKGGKGAQSNDGGYGGHERSYAESITSSLRNWGGAGGSAGSAGSNGTGGSLHRDTSSAAFIGTVNGGTAYASSHSSIEYTLTMSDDWRTNEVYAVKLGYDMPSAAPVMSRENYTFLGWFDAKNGLGTKYYNADGTPVYSLYDHVGDLTLYAGWQIVDASAASVTVNGVGIVGGVNNSGTGWTYDGTTGMLRFTSMLQDYVISGNSMSGDVWIKADCNAAFILDGLALDTSQVGGRPPFVIDNGYYPKIEVAHASRLVGGVNSPGISVADMAKLDIRGSASLFVKGGPGAADIGPSGSVSSSMVFIDTKGPDVHPARFKLESDYGWASEFYSKGTGERVWCVKVPGEFAQGAAVAWAGLPEDYSPTNTIGDEDGRAYLWLPEGVHVFSSLTASGKKDWVAWVESAHATAQPFASRGVTVNGTDIGYLKGDGWSFDNDHSLYLTNSGPFVLSGETAPGRDVVTVNVNADSSVTLSNLTLNVASGDYRAAIQLLSGVSADIFISGTNSLSGYVNHAAVSVPSGSTVTLRGDGYLRAEGGSGSPGIGSSRYAAFGTVNIAGGTIDAFGGSYAPGIGVGDGSTSGDFLGGRVVITGGTVYSKRDTAYLHNGQADIGKSDYGLCGQVIISGGSVKGYGTDGTVSTWKVKPAATNSLGAAVFPVTVPGLEASAGASMAWLTSAGASLGYGMDGVHADEEGDVYLWLPSNTYYFIVNGHGYRASVEGGAAVAEPWESCVFVDGVDVCAGSGAGWTYMDRTVSFDDSGRTYLVTGTNTAGEVKFSAVDGVTLCLTNLSIAATNVLTATGAVKVNASGPSRLVATGEKLVLGTGSVEILDGTLDLTGDTSASVVVSGGSVKYSGTPSPYFKNLAGDRVWRVTVDELTPGAKVGDVAPWASGSFPAYGSDEIYADAEGQIYLWLPNGAYDFVVTKEESGEERECVVFVRDNDAVAKQYEPYGFFVDGRDIGHYVGEGWYLNDMDKHVGLANTRDFVLNGSITNMVGVKALVDACVTLSNAIVNVESVQYLSAFSTAVYVDLDIVLLGTNNLCSGRSAAGVQSSEGATVRLRGEGSLYVQGGYQAAGIGSGYNATCGSVLIEGGRIKARGGEHAAGIGAGDAPSAGFDAGGTVRMSGGRVIAVCSADASPIGSSRNAHPGTVWIEGGTVQVDAQGGEGVLGSSPTSGGVGSVVIRGGAVYATTNTVLPVYRNHLSAQVFPLLLDLAEPESRVTGVELGLPAMSYYGDNLKDVYTDADGNLKIWLPSTGGKVLKISITTESGETYRYCYIIDDDGTVLQVEFIAVNDDFVMSGTDSEGSGWNYRWDATKKTGVLSLTLDASVTGVATSGLFRIVVPSGGADELKLNKLVLEAKNAKFHHAVSISNDVSVVLLRDSEIRATGDYSAGMDIATEASATFRGDGSLTAYGGKAAAGIGSYGYKAVPGKITVESGKVAAYGGKDAAGIGGGLNCNLSSGGIVICGGIVRAHGGANAAGIGAGKGAVNIPERAVTVKGGTVLAWGGDAPRQVGGMGGSQSQSDLILSLGNSADVTGYTYKPFVVTGGSVMPEMTTIDKVAPRPADDRGTELYSVTFTNLVPGAAADISCDDIPDGFGLDDIFADDEGRVSIWLAPTNHARSIVVNGLSYKTEYPYAGSDEQVLYRDVVAECLGPAVVAKSKSVPIMAMSVSSGLLSVVLPESSLDVPPETKKKGAKVLLASPSPLNVRIYRSKTLPFPDEPEVVSVLDCSVTPNGDGTVTVSIPLSGEERQMFYKIVE